MKNKLSIYTLWSIGKKVYYNQNNFNNIFQKYSNYYSYFYGNSYLFTRENIRYMLNLYLNFPIYYSKLECFNWDQYRILFSISDREERFFYFRILLFFNSNYNNIKDLIDNDYYNRV
ncbi:MAG: hypothetical protein IJI22_01900 [Bacilli bacterium]|nr:hypothetical protein [Bacilli bacterium]